MKNNKVKGKFPRILVDMVCRILIIICSLILNEDKISIFILFLVFHFLYQIKHWWKQKIPLFLRNISIRKGGTMLEFLSMEFKFLFLYQKII